MNPSNDALKVEPCSINQARISMIQNFFEMVVYIEYIYILYVASISNLDHALLSACYHTLQAARTFTMNFESRAHDLYQRIAKDCKLGWTAYNFAARIVEEYLADLGKIKSC